MEIRVSIFTSQSNNSIFFKKISLSADVQMMAALFLFDSRTSQWHYSRLDPAPTHPPIQHNFMAVFYPGLAPHFHLISV